MEEEYILLSILIMMILVFIFIIMFSEFILRFKKTHRVNYISKVRKARFSKAVMSDVTISVDRRKWNGKRQIEIDSIVITNDEILCVKFIDFNGYIFGNEVSKIWWCVNNEKKKIINPMEQVFNQSKQIDKILKNNFSVTPVLVFFNETNTSYLKASNEVVKLFNENEFIYYLNSKLFEKKIINKKDKKFICKQIESYIIN